MTVNLSRSAEDLSYLVPPVGDNIYDLTVLLPGEDTDLLLIRAAILRNALIVMRNRPPLRILNVTIRYTTATPNYLTNTTVAIIELILLFLESQINVPDSKPSVRKFALSNIDCTHTPRDVVVQLSGAMKRVRIKKLELHTVHVNYDFLPILFEDMNVATLCLKYTRTPPDINSTVNQDIALVDVLKRRKPFTDMLQLQRCNSSIVLRIVNALRDSLYVINKFELTGTFIPGYSRESIKQSILDLLKHTNMGVQIENIFIGDNTTLETAEFFSNIIKSPHLVNIRLLIPNNFTNEDFQTLTDAVLGLTRENSHLESITWVAGDNRTLNMMFPRAITIRDFIHRETSNLYGIKVVNDPRALVKRPLLPYMKEFNSQMKAYYVTKTKNRDMLQTQTSMQVIEEALGIDNDESSGPGRNSLSESAMNQ